MRQQVNLYLPEFRPQRDWLSSLRMLQIAAVMLVLMLLLSGTDMLRRWNLEEQLQRLQEDLQIETAATNALEQELARRSGNQNLTRDLATREERLVQARELLSFLRTTNLGNIDGLSEYLKDLSRASFPGMWLTEFRFSAGGEQVYLQGVVEQSAMLPDFIGRLSQGRSELRYRQFTRLSSSRRAGALVEGPQAESFGFVLETQR